MSRRSTVWIGDLDSSIDEEFLIETFKSLGEPLCSVKIIRRNTESLCYGFLEFPDEESAQRVLHRYNGKPIPNTNLKRFKLNHANHSKDGSNSQKEYSLFVGDLGPDVDDLALFDAFLIRYKTVKLAKVIYDSFGVSKGYGFVHFSNKCEYEAALVEMQNAHIGSKSVRVSTAQQKRSTAQTPAPSQEELQWQQQYPGYDYQSYYAAWQNYHAQNPYYSYDQHYGTYGTTYQYAQQYSYGDAAETTPVAAAAAAATTTAAAATTTTTTTTLQSTASSQQSETEYGQSSYEVPDNTIVEHDIPLDIEQMNQELMQKNEDLYTALEDSRWLPVDGLNPPLIRFK